MHDRPAGSRLGAKRVRRILPAVAAVVAAAVMCAPAMADTMVNVIGDSVIVTGQPPGAATIRVTRPDALTGKPVVIGLYSGSPNGSLPLTVNTTTATAFSPDGDCWQQGALSQAVTPDIRPGDTVTVTGDPGPLGSPTSTSVVVPPDGAARQAGPIPSCNSVAPFAQNAVTGAPKTVTGGSITVSGVAQPLATGVAAAVTDGSRSTAPVGVTPNADGSWSATIPAAQADVLANGTLTVDPVYAVPDVSTGAPAHITGAPLSLQMARVAAPGSPAANSAPTPGGAARGTGRAKPRVSGVRVQSPISLAQARGGLRASFVVPGGGRVVDVRLLLGKRTVVHRVVSAGKAGKRQTVVLTGTALRRALRSGRYTLAVRCGASRSRLGTAVLRTIRVR
jgi:hypothetical protein